MIGLDAYVKHGAEAQPRVPWAGLVWCTTCFVQALPHKVVGCDLLLCLAICSELRLFLFGPITRGMGWRSTQVRCLESRHTFTLRRARSLVEVFVLRTGWCSCVAGVRRRYVPNHHLSTGRPLSGVSLGGVLSVSTDKVMIESSDLEPRFISLKRVNHAQEIWFGRSSE